MDTIVSFFTSLLDWVERIALTVWDWLVALLADGVDSLLSPLESYIPDLSGMWSALSPIAPYTAFLNQWIALDFGLSLLTAYLTYIGVMITVKLVIKLFIPTVG